MRAPKILAPLLAFWKLTYGAREMHTFELLAIEVQALHRRHALTD
jgi:hypothetical protein